jgi:hypothetical protein
MAAHRAERFADRAKQLKRRWRLEAKAAEKLLQERLVRRG